MEERERPTALIKKKTCHESEIMVSIDYNYVPSSFLFCHSHQQSFTFFTGELAAIYRYITCEL